MNEKIDIDLIPLQKIRAGDKNAFNEIFTRYEKPIFNLIRSMVGNYQDSQDLMMVTFEKAYKKIETFIPEHLFKTWLSRIATNTALDFIKVSSHHPQAIKDIDILISYVENRSPDPCQNMISRENLTFIRKAIKCLSEPDRQAILLEIYDSSPKDDAGRVRLFRARKQLKKLIA